MFLLQENGDLLLLETGGSIVLEQAPDHVLSQYAFRFRNDDGNEANATWLEAENTNVIVDKNNTVRLRITIDN